MQARIEDLTALSRDKQGFRIVDTIGESVPSWLSHTLLRTMWDLLSCWGEIHLLPENQVVQLSLVLGRGEMAMVAQDHRHRGFGLLLIVAKPNEENFRAECDLMLKNGIRVLVDKNLDFRFAIASLIAFERYFSSLGYRKDGRRLVIPCLERLVVTPCSYH